LVSALCLQTAAACTIIIPPLRKEFRKAKAVFVGKITDVSFNYLPTEKEKRDIPEYWTEGAWKDKNIFSKVTVEINNEWKGGGAGKRVFVAVAQDFCACAATKMSEFKAGEEYLFFAAGKNFVAVCDSDKTDSQWTIDKMQRLDDFWFRVWAGIYPF
jgi:hypothetical protein